MSDPEGKILRLIEIANDPRREKGERLHAHETLSRIAPHLVFADGRVMTPANYENFQRMFAELERYEQTEKENELWP